MTLFMTQKEYLKSKDKINTLISACDYVVVVGPSDDMTLIKNRLATQEEGIDKVVDMYLDPLLLATQEELSE